MDRLPDSNTRVTQFKSSLTAVDRKVAVPLLLLFISMVIDCASTPRTIQTVSFKEIAWEEVDRNQTPTQADYPKANAVFLLDEGEFSVTSHCISTEHLVIKALNEAGLKHANVEIPFNSEDEVHNIKGRTIRKDGTIVELQPEDIHEKSIFPHYVLYTDSKAKVFAMPGVEVGSVIEYSYSILHKSPFSTTWKFQRDEPVLLSSITLDIPVSLKYNSLRSGRKGIEIEKSVTHLGGRAKVVYTVRNAPAITHEPFMPSPSETTAQIHFSLVGLSFIQRVYDINLHINLLIADSWEALGRNYWLGINDKIKADEAITSQVHDLIVGFYTDREKIAALYDFVQSKIRYAAVAIKEGRIIPHEPAEVFRNKYGDCKDKAFLFITMMKEAGIDALPVLARTSSSGEVIDGFVSAQQFNHMVVAIPAKYLPDLEGYEEVVVRGDKEYFVSDDYIVLDATSRANPFGKIPWYLENTKALLIQEKGSKLITIPSSSANANKTTRVCEAEIGEDGTFFCSVKCTKTGQEADRFRSLFQPLSEREQRERFENTLSYTCPGAILEELSVWELFELAKPLTLNYKFRIPQYAQNIGRLLTFSPSIFRELMVDMLTRETREHSICFDYCKLLVDVMNITIPTGYDIKSVPDAFSRTSSFGDYSFSCFTDREKIVLNKQLSINERSISRAHYRMKIKPFFENIAASERRNVVLCRKGPFKPN